jgi:hypothetical protein
MSWEKLTQDITFYAFYVASKVGKTGITVTADVWEHTRTGTATEVVSGGSATEIGDGLYKYVLSAASVDAVGEYVAVFKTADATVDAQHIPALWIVGRAGVENLDAAISSRNATAPLDATATQAAAAAALTAYDAATGSDVPSVGAVADAVWDEALSGHATAGTTGAALSAAGGAADPLLNAVPGSYASGTAGNALGRIVGANITIQSPVSDDGDAIFITGGDDYLYADGRAVLLTWGDTHPSASGGSIKLTLTDDPSIEYSGQVTAARAGYIEFTAAETTAIEAAGKGLRNFRVQVTQSNGHKYSPLVGKMIVS